MGYLPDETVAAFRGSYRLGLFFRLDTDPGLHLWFGISDIAAKIADVDVDGTIYLGAGFLTDAPDSLEVLINGSAERADWVLSGVPAELAANLANDAPSVVGKRATFGISAMDDRWQMQSDIIPMWEGTADFWAEEQPVQTDPSRPKLRKLTLATMTGDASRALPYYSTWTDAIQRTISPTDKFCERVPRYYQGQIIRWPRY